MLTTSLVSALPTEPISLPTWLLAPQGDRAPEAAAQELHNLHIVRQMARAVGREPESLTDIELAELAAEIGQDKELLAIIQGEALEHADQLAQLFERATIILAHQVSNTPFWAYHPDHYSSWQEMLRAKIRPGNARYLNWICGVLIPWMNRHGYEDAISRVWDEDTVAKTKIMVDQVRASFNAAGITGEETADLSLPPVPALRIEAMLGDVVDEKVNATTFQEKHRLPPEVTRTETPPIPAFEFIAGEGSYLVLVCTDKAQIAHAKMALKAAWHLGTGKEKWLDQLVGKKLRKRMVKRTDSNQKLLTPVGKSTTLPKRLSSTAVPKPPSTAPPPPKTS